MTFIKRLITLIILVLVGFGIFHLISPTKANHFLTRIKTVANTKLGTHFSLTGSTIIDIMTWNILSTWDTLSWTQTQTGSENSDFFLGQQTWLIDETYSGTIQETGDTHVQNYANTETTTPPPPATQPTQTPPPKTPTPSQQGLSSQDMKDLKDFLKNFK